MRIILVMSRRVYSTRERQRIIAAASVPGASLRAVARENGVPPPTLRYWLKHPESVAPLDRTRLGREAERGLADAVIKSAEAGHPMSRSELLQAAMRLTRGQLGTKFLENFRKRNGLSSRVSQPRVVTRVAAEDPDAIRQYFRNIGAVLAHLGLADRPECVLNMDETMVEYNPTKVKVIARTGARKVCRNN